MVIRLSQELAKRIKKKDLPDLLPAHDPYLDWHAHIFNFGRGRYLILGNSVSLFSVVMWSKGITTTRKFIEDIASPMQEVLHASGFGELFKTKIAPNLKTIQFAKTENRRIIGSINDLVQTAQFLLDYEDLSPLEISLKLNENILSVTKYKKPRKAFADMRPEVEDA